ncbi:MAG: hypothetical protein E7088_03695 [Bacteroidales bacterium]|nr:hypothetical protein [Bacteroidales bacterium]
MKSIKHFVLDLATTIAVCVPCTLFFNWIGKKTTLDGFNVLIIAATVSLFFVLTNILFKRCKKGKGIHNILSTLATISITATITYSCFMLLEWMFSSIGSGSGYDWEHWIALSLSLTIFFQLQERRKEDARAEYGKSPVVLANCKDRVESTVIKNKLAGKNIEAIIVERENPMYIKEQSDSDFQIQILEEDLQNARKVIENENLLN